MQVTANLGVGTGRSWIVITDENMETDLKESEQRRRERMENELGIGSPRALLQGRLKKDSPKLIVPYKLLKIIQKVA